MLSQLTPQRPGRRGRELDTSGTLGCMASKKRSSRSKRSSRRSRHVTTRYRDWQIKSNPYSHRGQRHYEAGIYGWLPAEQADGLADVAHGPDRATAIAHAQQMVDAHLSGERPLRNFGIKPEVWREIVRDAGRRR